MAVWKFTRKAPAMQDTLCGSAERCTADEQPMANVHAMWHRLRSDVLQQRLESCSVPLIPTLHSKWCTRLQTTHVSHGCLAIATLFKLRIFGQVCIDAPAWQSR